MILPQGLPQLPPVPEGFDRWIDRKTEWRAECATYVSTSLDAKFAGVWVVHHEAPAHGSPTHHYIEAVREPAKDDPDDPDNLEGNGRTREEMAAAARELNHIAPTPADKFALMFDKSERPTPLTDALWVHCVRNPGPGSGLRLAMHARNLERQLAEAREALEDLVAQDDWQEPFNGLDMSRARQALALINKTETP